MTLFYAAVPLCTGSVQRRSQAHAQSFKQTHQLYSVYCVLRVCLPGSFPNGHLHWCSCGHRARVAVMGHNCAPVPHRGSNPSVDPSAVYPRRSVGECPRYKFFQICIDTRSQNPMKVPNPEQTASLFSLAFYFFLDPIVFLAYRESQLPEDSLNPLCDIDASSHLVKRSFRVTSSPRTSLITH